jgi:excisionase family DNA binding protein
MTFRPHIAGNPTDAPRPTGTVKTVAEMLATHQSQVRRMVQTGELEAHRIGKRGVRIFLDSVADFQTRTTRESLRGSESPKPKIRRNAASTAAHRAALAILKAKGCLR